MAIEYDGVRYHGDHTSYRDYEKNELCQHNGITLIRIREERIEPMEGKEIIIIPYPNTRTYSNIGIAIHALFAVLNERYGLFLDTAMKIGILEDDKVVVRYIQDKYTKGSG